MLWIQIKLETHIRTLFTHRGMFVLISKTVILKDGGGDHVGAIQRGKLMKTSLNPSVPPEKCWRRQESTSSTSSRKRIGLRRWSVINPLNFTLSPESEKIFGKQKPG